MKHTLPLLLLTACSQPTEPELLAEFAELDCDKQMLREEFFNCQDENRWQPRFTCIDQALLFACKEKEESCKND